MLLFFDIETAPIAKLHELPGNLQPLWKERYCKDMPKTETHDTFYIEKAGLYAEFSRILCISCGYQTEEGSICIKTYQGEERDIIANFFIAILKFKLAGFNIKQFDIPFICKRAIVSGLNIPKKISPIGKKPWEVDHVDIMEIWKFNGFIPTGLAVVCEILGIPTPKGEMNGADVGKYYQETGDVKKIIEYCERDVKATIEVYKKISNCVAI